MHNRTQYVCPFDLWGLTFLACHQPQFILQNISSLSRQIKGEGFVEWKRNTRLSTFSLYFSIYKQVTITINQDWFITSFDNWHLDYNYNIVDISAHNVSFLKISFYNRWYTPQHCIHNRCPFFFTPVHFLYFPKTFLYSTPYINTFYLFIFIVKS